MDDRGDEREGGIGAGVSPEVPWRWPTAAVVEEDPFRFFNDSTI